MFNLYVKNKDLNVTALIRVFNLMPAAGRLIIEKDAQTVKFLTERSKLRIQDYRNINDTLSLLPKIPCFNEHHHNQSVYSLLFSAYKGIFVKFGNVWPESRLKY